MLAARTFASAIGAVSPITSECPAATPRSLLLSIAQMMAFCRGLPELTNFCDFDWSCRRLTLTLFFLLFSLIIFQFITVQLQMRSILAASAATAANPITTRTTTDKPVMPKSILFATSGLGGCLGWCVIHPANTIAVRMSLASMQGKPFSLMKMGQEMGWMSVYDGLSAGLLRQVFYATARFGLFETCRDYAHEIRGKTDFASRFVIGAVTGGMAAYISCPMEVAVVRMSNDKSLPEAERRNYKGVADTASRIIREEGISAFWRGSTPFVARAMMVGVFQVATMDQFKDMYANLLDQKLNSIPNVFSAAMTSGLIYSVATMPLEATKNRMASQKMDPVTGKLPYTSIAQTIRMVSAKDGFFALYNGFTPYYIRCGGHTVAMFIFVQMLRDAYTVNALV